MIRRSRMALSPVFATLLAFALSARLVTSQLDTSPFHFTFPDCQNGPLAGTGVCNTALDPKTRAQSLVDLLTPEELLNNTVNRSPGAPRIGLPAYEWGSEALHGVAISLGLNFTDSGEFSYATSFPQAILTGAAFDDPLVQRIATIISTEGRAYNNAARAGLNFLTPNINPFRDPRWSRGQETPGEDPYRSAQYAFNLIQGLQGGIDPDHFKVAAECKHFAAYDLEDWGGIERYEFNAVVTQQDLVEYYLPPFQACVRDAKVASVMCSYNAINGTPACANSWLLQDILRDFFGFGEDRWVIGDCTAVGNVFDHHHFVDSYTDAAAVSLNAGTDIDCGNTYITYLPDALQQGLISLDRVKSSFVRQYTSLIRLGYFDPPAGQPFRQLSWNDVNTKEAQQLAYQAAVEGIVLLKNDGILPLDGSTTKVAIIGPWANATVQMQGNYFGPAPFLISPYQGAQNAGYTTTYALGTGINSTSDSGFAEALAAAQDADLVIYAGGIDNTVEAEFVPDRLSIAWPGNQLELVAQLEGLGKPLVVLQFGGGQVDDTPLKNTTSVNAIVWCGYPGQSGGTAIFDILKGVVAPAGRLVTTQYPAEFTDQVPMSDMHLRPSATNPGRTYQWYTGTPVYEFGYGLHYTNFTSKWALPPLETYDIQTLAKPALSSPSPDLVPLITLEVEVTNTGGVPSDYVALLFVQGEYGPKPYYNKKLVAYERLFGVGANGKAKARLSVTIGSLARSDEWGNSWLYPGVYDFLFDVTGELSARFYLTGVPVQLTHWPQPH